DRFAEQSRGILIFRAHSLCRTSKTSSTSRKINSVSINDRQVLIHKLYSIRRSCCSVSGGDEVIAAFGWCEAIDAAADRSPAGRRPFALRACARRPWILAKPETARERRVSRPAAPFRR